MKIWACSSEVCTHWPSPETSRSRSAVRMPMARAAQLLSPGVLEQRVNLDDVGTPVRKLPHAGGTRANPREIEHGEAGQGLGSTREGHSRHSGNGISWYRKLSGYRQSRGER